MKALDRAKEEVAILNDINSTGWTREAVQQSVNTAIAIAIAIRAGDPPPDFPLCCHLVIDGVAQFVERGGRVVFIDPKEDA